MKLMTAAILGQKKQWPEKYLFLFVYFAFKAIN
jgi:hypothetical protein